MKTTHFRTFLIILLLTALCTAPVGISTTAPQRTPRTGAKAPVRGTDGNSLPTDLSAWLLVAAPGNDIYSGWGHCALRLSCPSRGLDYFFTYGLELTGSSRLHFFAGTSKARFHVMRPRQYMQGYISENRTLEQYRLNLTVEETRTLWRLADEGAQESAVHDLTFEYHCAAEVLRLVAGCLQNACINYGHTVPYSTFRQFFNHCSYQCPWSAFWWKMLYGAQGDEPCAVETLLNPMVLVPVLRHATIEDNNGFVRPLLADGARPDVLYKARPDGPATPGTLHQGIMVCKDRTHDLYSLTSPVGVFACILLLAVAVTAGQWRLRWHRLPQLFDAVLLVLQSMAAVLITYCTFFSAKQAFHGNVRIVIFNILPLLTVLAGHILPRFRTSGLYGRVWLAMAAVCLLFALSAPFSAQTEAPYVLMALTFALRCAIYARSVRRQ